MNNEQQQIIDEVYNNYLNKVKNYTTEDLFYNALSGVGDIIEGMLSPYTRDFRPYTREEFIDKCKTEEALSLKWMKEYGDLKYASKEEIEHLSKHCKTDPEFSEKWGLKIEERELSLEERSIIAGSNHNEVSQNIKIFTGIDEDHTLHKNLDDNSIPTKLITITYNDKTI